MKLDEVVHRPRNQDDHWIPLSDLMTGLMMIFMLVAIVFMIQIKRDEEKTKEVQRKVKDIASLYTDLRAQLYQDLESEFGEDFKIWRASVRRDLSVRFEEPSVQFDIGASVLKPSFAVILDSFFPRYSKILSSPKYRDYVEEVRIEGHTSRKWAGQMDEKAYYENMKLSQERTRTVLAYVFRLPRIQGDLYWLVPRVTANGLSSSKPIFLSNGAEDEIGSQRVEFKVRTKAEDRIEEMLKALSK